MQIHIKYMKIANFLFQRYVPNMPTPLCSCGKAPETFEHVLLHYNEIAEKRETMQQQVAFIALRIRWNLA
jgi:hypothetical protein